MLSLNRASFSRSAAMPFSTLRWSESIVPARMVASGYESITISPMLLNTLIPAPPGSVNINASIIACTTSPSRYKVRGGGGRSSGLSRYLAPRPTIADSRITRTPMIAPGPPSAIRYMIGATHATAAAAGPKNSEHRLIMTDLPSKISPGPKVRGLRIPIKATPPNSRPCTRASAVLERFRRLSMNPESMVIDTKRDRLRIKSMYDSRFTSIEAPVPTRS